MSIISHMSVDYDAPVVEVQSDSSATDLENAKVPTGQTIKSYLTANNNIVPISETDYAALTPAQKQNGKAYFRYEADSIMRDIQDNASATDLNSGDLPTGQTIKSYLNSNIVNAGSNQINFSTNPQTYATSGSMWVQIIGKVCILSFVDLKISNNPTANDVLITSNVIPKSKYQVSSILIDSTGTGGAQKVMMGAGTNSICNYWTSDSFRKSGSFHGQLVYIIA